MCYAEGSNYKDYVGTIVIYAVLDIFNELIN